MNCMMSLKSLPHPQDGYPFLPYHGMVWETREWAVHGPTVLDLEELQETPLAECCETQRYGAEESALCKGNVPSSFIAIFPEYILPCLQT